MQIDQLARGSDEIAKQKTPAVFGTSIPIDILRDRDVSALEAIVRYLKEEQKLTYSQIAQLLNRDDRTVWTTYKRAAKKFTRIEHDSSKGDRL